MEKEQKAGVDLRINNKFAGQDGALSEIMEAPITLKDEELAVSKLKM
jgi:hypothetical protein